MPRKNKVESSPHYEEIINLLLEGESGRNISTYLKEKYDEDIGFNAINTYRRKHINMEDKVLNELDKRLAEKTDEKVKQYVDSIEHVEQSMSTVVDKTVTQLQGLLDVSEDYPETVQKMEEEANDPNSKTSWKDVANEKRNAKKIFLDYVKIHESNVEVNVNNSRSILEDVFDEEVVEDALNDDN